MKRQVKWGRAVEKGTGSERLSKCGRFRIVTRFMASGRNGHFNTPAYSPERVSDGRRLCREMCDTLASAMDEVEWANDPNWEP